MVVSQVRQFARHRGVCSVLQDVLLTDLLNVGGLSSRQGLDVETIN